jgi:hypothetical protein
MVILYYDKQISGACPRESFIRLSTMFLNKNGEKQNHAEYAMMMS